ncbi:hypothetical protein GCM10010182_48550 [Actinomadura cremea]|nr:hypothetical protein GCM10010182_48550 [Actinomadura cremea]
MIFKVANAGVCFVVPHGEALALQVPQPTASTVICGIPGPAMDPPVERRSVVFVVYGALITIVPWLVLGLVALIRVHPQDIPDVIQALSRWGRRY